MVGVLPNRSHGLIMAGWKSTVQTLWTMLPVTKTSWPPSTNSSIPMLVVLTRGSRRPTDTCQRLPHLLLYGPPGTGKTSTILARARRIYGVKNMRQMVLELNASDDRGIEVVREQIKTFASMHLTAVGDDRSQLDPQAPSRSSPPPPKPETTCLSRRTSSSSSTKPMP